MVNLGFSSTFLFNIKNSLSALVFLGLSSACSEGGSESHSEKGKQKNSSTPTERPSDEEIEKAVEKINKADNEKNGKIAVKDNSTVALSFTRKGRLSEVLEVPSRISRLTPPMKAKSYPRVRSFKGVKGNAFLTGYFDASDINALYYASADGMLRLSHLSDGGVSASQIYLESKGKVVYSATNGLLMYDLDSGSRVVISEDSHTLRVSSDQTKLMFIETIPSQKDANQKIETLTVVDAEGKKIVSLHELSAADYKMAYGSTSKSCKPLFSEDGNNVLFGVKKEDKIFLHSMDIAKKKTRQVSDFPLICASFSVQRSYGFLEQVNSVYAVVQDKDVTKVMVKDMDTDKERLISAKGEEDSFVSQGVYPIPNTSRLVVKTDKKTQIVDVESGQTEVFNFESISLGDKFFAAISSSDHTLTVLDAAEGKVLTVDLPFKLSGGGRIEGLQLTSSNEHLVLRYEEYATGSVSVFSLSLESQEVVNITDATEDKGFRVVNDRALAFEDRVAIILHDAEKDISKLKLVDLNEPGKGSYFTFKVQNPDDSKPDQKIEIVGETPTNKGLYIHTSNCSGTTDCRGDGYFAVDTEAKKVADFSSTVAGVPIGRVDFYAQTPDKSMLVSIGNFNHPDGKQIAVTDLKSKEVTLVEQGTTSYTSQTCGHRISGNSKKMLYLERVTTQWQPRVLDLSTKKTHAIAEAVDCHHAEISPDASLVAYFKKVSEEKEGTYTIYLADSRGKDKLTLYSDTRELSLPGDVFSHPKKVRFSFIDSENIWYTTLAGELIVYNILSKGHTVIHAYDEDKGEVLNPEQIRSSSDVNKIFYRAGAALYAASLDGKENKRVSGGIPVHTRPIYNGQSFSLHGDRILFQSSEGNRLFHLVKTDGSELRQVNSFGDGGSNGYNPYFSPGGNKIIFEDYMTEKKSTLVIKTSNIDGSNAVVLDNTAADAKHSRLYLSGDLSHAFSADGANLLLHKSILGGGGSYTLYANTVGASTLKEVTSGVVIIGGAGNTFVDAGSGSAVYAVTKPDEKGLQTVHLITYKGDILKSLILSPGIEISEVVEHKADTAIVKASYGFNGLTEIFLLEM